MSLWSPYSSFYPEAGYITGLVIAQLTSRLNLAQLVLTMFPHLPRQVGQSHSSTVILTVYPLFPDARLGLHWSLHPVLRVLSNTYMENSFDTLNADFHEVKCYCGKTAKMRGMCLQTVFRMNGLLASMSPFMPFKVLVTSRVLQPDWHQYPDLQLVVSVGPMCVNCNQLLWN